MAFADRLFRRGRSPQVDLSALLVRLTAGVVWWSGRPADPDLVRARLCDGCRDAGVDPPMPKEFDTRAAGLDDEAWNRLGVLAFALDVPDIQAALAALTAARPSLELLEAGFIDVTRRTPLLTLELLGRSALRVEEMTRRLVEGLGVALRGEPARISRERLQRLDYERLLAEAERARESAAGRLEELQRLQDQQEQRRPRRGKW